jgi:hypothetical protein
MRTFLWMRRAASFCTLGVFLAACATSPSALNLPDSAQHRPGAQAQDGGGALLYVGSKQSIEVYSFPSGVHRASLHSTGIVRAMCSDSNGNVFVAAAPVKSSKSGSGSIYEYAHDGKAPIATLEAPKDDVPIACSRDSTTGNLAVTNRNSKKYTPSVSIYANAAGTPTVYTSGAIGANPQAGFDDSGNLFVTSGGNLGVLLPNGATDFTKITLTKTLGGVDHVQWDGKYFALQSFDTLGHNGEKLFERVFRVQISGSSGRVVNATHFIGWPEHNAGQSWIDGTTIVATPYDSISLWNYPAGGKAVKVIHPGRPGKAVTVSLAP